MSAIQGLLISIEVIMERPSRLSELSVISWVSAVVWWPMRKDCGDAAETVRKDYGSTLGTAKTVRYTE